MDATGRCAEGRRRLVGEEPDGVDVGVVQGAVALLVVEAEYADRFALQDDGAEDEGAGAQRLDLVVGGLQHVVGGVLGDVLDEVDLPLPESSCI